MRANRKCQIVFTFEMYVIYLREFKKRRKQIFDDFQFVSIQIYCGTFSKSNKKKKEKQDKILINLIYLNKIINKCLKIVPNT